MYSDFLKRLFHFQVAPTVVAQDRFAFYGLSVLSLLLAWSEQQVMTPGLFPLLCLFIGLACSAYFLWLAWIDKAPSFVPAFVPENIEVFAPLLVGLCWAGLTWGTAVVGASSVVLVLLLSTLLLFMVLPFGTTSALLFSFPIFLAANRMLLLGPWEDSARLAVLLNLCFLVFWFTTVRSKDSVGGKSYANEVKPAGVQSANIQVLRQAAELEVAAREKLESQLQHKEQDFELNIREQTKYLRDANTQLSQQIALRKTISDALVKSQTRLTQAIDASHLGLVDWNVAQGQFYQSAFHKQFGEKEQTSEQVIQTLKEVIHPSDYITVRDTLNECLRGDCLAYQLQYRVKDDADWIWIEESGKVVDTEGDGRAARILGTRRNIQSEVFRDEQVRLAKSVFDHTSEGVFVLDPQGCFLSSNPAYEIITGHKADEIVGHSITDISGTPQREEVYRKILDDARVKGRWQGEILEKPVHGDYFPQWTQINAIYDERNDVKYFACMVSDLSDRKAADEKLDYLINYDDLTKLANRVQFQDQLHRALLRFKDEGVPFALVLLDIDRFKQFNDSFGHELSDELLKEIALRLSNSVQKVDILARVGGNEFACVVACSPTFSVDKFTDRLFKIVSHGGYEVDGNEVVLSCSIGIAMVPEHTQDIETLMRYGALAVQKAKYQGGNQVQTFDESLKSFSRQRLEMEQELRKALTNHELEVFYQPKLDLKAGRITSFEALVRWRHPVKGLISPDEFVNIAEENGLILDLGSYVLETACNQTQQWIEQGFGQLHVSVNLSPRQLKESGFKALVSDILEITNISPENLELELTESAIMEDTANAIGLLDDLRALGIKVSVDDFGTGYSSLSYLKELPIDTLKIDRSFVENMENSTEQQAIVKAIIVLGDSLNLQIVAEGVENDAQLGMLKALGCNLIQGYHVSKPITAEGMAALLLAQKEQA